jgi:uncharacterized membrane protein YfcA
MIIPFDLATFAIAAAVVFGAYVVFGISAFGAALFVVPILSHFLPLEVVLPMVVLLDVSASLALGVRISREADWSELKWMVPMSAAGAVAGVTLLVALPRQVTIAGIGILLVLYSMYSLRQGAATATVSRAWGAVAGFVGGAFGTLFGVGAPPYAIYLAHRLQHKLAYRATLSNMVVFSVSIRAVVFAAGGLMLADRLIGFAMLVPFCLAGLWLGNRLQTRISRAGLLRVVAVLLLLIGLSLLARALAGG